ncbi:MAG TPA: serpin family protein [Micromonosporaceae bacterium]|jgi:serpin B
MRKIWATLVGVMLVATGCATQAGPAPVPGGLRLLKADVARLDPPADAPVAQVVAGIATFGYNLAPAQPGGNWVASPASIAIVLAMLRAGANGATADEIDHTFGFPAGVQDAFNALSRQLVTADVPPSTSDEPTRAPGAPARPSVVCMGNAIFPAQGFPIKDSYLQVLAQQYGSGVYPLDFQTSAAKDAIDAWARDTTAGRIQKVFDHLDPATAAVVANTVYFKGEWRVPFDDTNTADKPFHRADGSTVNAPTMRDQLGVGYAEGSGWQAIELPYGEDGAYAMRVLLPTAGQSPRDLLNPSLGASFSTQPVDIELPKWDFATDVPLLDELVRLGVVSAFDPNRADFSGISQTGLYVSQAIHRANITVDEYGTQAAAVTAAALMPTSAHAPATISFHADHPFAFQIVHTATGTVLFDGIVVDPTAS